MPSTTTALACAAALSTQTRWQSALQEGGNAAMNQLGGAADLAALFFSPHHAASADRIAIEAATLLGTSNLIGCTGEGIAGTGREIEEDPAFSLWLARLP